ncbi:MAG: tRNA pseudouridine(13) synthase TruD [Polyangiaceae bacterium]|nr:tRNA pseudouridine(13) synthase TruD [Polyangiaceae bacterium]
MPQSHEPLRFHADLRPAGGKIGPLPEDFVVDEVGLYPLSGKGPHWFVRIRKRGWTTPSMVGALARAAAVDPRDIGTAGMKDKNGVTTQWLSLPDKAPPPQEWRLPEGLELVEHTRHENKLRTGHLRGNRFDIRLVGIEDGGVERARALCERIEKAGLANCFGAQRFGVGGGNLGQALRWLTSTAQDSSASRRPGRDRARRPRSRSRFDDKLYPSVLQSEVFNRYVTLRRATGLERLLRGEVVRLHGSNSVFVVVDPDVELPRLLAGDLHLTGPLPGPKMRAAQEEAAELERQVLAELPLGPDDWERLGRYAPGTRRDLVMRPEGLEVVPIDDHSLRVRFELPSGGYATELVREITGGPWLGARD